MYRPSELHLFLNELGIAPKKGLSQNFLIDGNIIRKIVKAAHVQPQDIVLEVGPGPGSLTQALLEAGAQVIAVEKDPVLAQALERLQTPTQQLQVICQDILQFPLNDYLTANRQVKVIANLPYHLTTPILVYLLSQRQFFSSLTVMVQEEVARRFTAKPSSKEYGSFTVFLQFYTFPHYAFNVSHHCFFPAPKVDSAVVHMDIKSIPALEQGEEAFFEITRTAFKQRRKMLRASLKGLFKPERMEEALKSIGQNPLARPEDLSLDEFILLYRKLYE